MRSRKAAGAGLESRSIFASKQKGKIFGGAVGAIKLGTPFFTVNMVVVMPHYHPPMDASPLGFPGDSAGIQPSTFIKTKKLCFHMDLLTMGTLAVLW